MTTFKGKTRSSIKNKQHQTKILVRQMLPKVCHLASGEVVHLGRWVDQEWWDLEWVVLANNPCLDLLWAVWWGLKVLFKLPLILAKLSVVIHNIQQSPLLSFNKDKKAMIQARKSIILRRFLISLKRCQYKRPLQGCLSETNHPQASNSIPNLSIRAIFRINLRMTFNCFTITASCIHLRIESNLYQT